MSEIIVICTDKNYVNHVKYNVKNIRDKNGEIDICIIYENIEDESKYIETELSKYNVILKPVDKLMDTRGPYGLTYHVFDSFFKKWDKILYLDCDTMVFSKLEPLFNQLDENNLFLVDYEGSTIKDFFTSWTTKTSKNNHIFELLNNETLVDINTKGFNCGIFCFSSSIIHPKTVEELYTIHKKYLDINNHAQNGKASDQPIINIMFGKIAKQVKNSNFCYWKQIKEETVIAHFCRWDAPWINSNFSEKIKTTYSNYYNNCL